MGRQISSRLTILYKFILPGTAFLFIAGWWSTTVPRPPEMVLFLPVLGIAISILIQWRLKKVYVDERNLYISDYRVEATIPITNIARVSEFFFSDPRRVTIHFKEPTVFGRKIVFMATYRFSPFAGFTSHPIVSELRHMISSA